MRLSKLHLLAYGPFTRQSLDFGSEVCGLALVHGANEAGKSSTLEAMADLRFGFEVQSKAGFLHRNTELSIGGEFIDSAGNPVGLLRRKGRGNTLTLADFNCDEPDTRQAAPPAMEQQLTAGLDRKSFHRLFGVDRDRMVQGGRDLFDTEGDIGVALFEASAGSRSIPDVLKKLEGKARELYVPRARKLGGSINQALNDYKRHKDELRDAQTLPREWLRLEQAYTTAVATLGILDARYKSLHSERLRLTELRTVWPMLSELDSHRRELDKLADIPLLVETAGEERRSINSSLSRNRITLQGRVDEIQRRTGTLAGLPQNDQLLDMSDAINRAIAAADSLEQKRLEENAASQSVVVLLRKLDSIVGRMDAARTVTELTDCIPSRSKRVQIDECLQRYGQAQRDLQSHVQAAQKDTREDDDAGVTLPGTAITASLRSARDDVQRHEIDLQRLKQLPVQRRAAERDLQQRLDELGLAEASALKQIRPLLDARIEEHRDFIDGAGRQALALATQATEIANKLQAQQSAEQTLLAQGEVATRDDVQRAREARELEWSELRRALVDASTENFHETDKRGELADRYSAQVEQADRVVDTLARDTERAARLQQCLYQQESLQKELEENRLRGEARKISLEKGEQQWQDQLRAARLPVQKPAEVRDWQIQLQSARHAQEQVLKLDDELVDLGKMEERLGNGLQAAMAACDPTATVTDAPLAARLTAAEEMLAAISLQQSEKSERVGQSKEREHQQLLRSRREKALQELLQSLAGDMASVRATLLLPADASVAMASARLQEFDELAEAQREACSADDRKQDAVRAVAALMETIETVRSALGDEPAIEPRLYCERLAARLRQAQELRKQQLLEQQALNIAVAAQQADELEIEALGAQLQQLCHLGGVDNAEALPEVEDQSTRKRVLRQSVDRLRSQLAQSSQQSEQELRDSLADKDMARLQSDEDDAVAAAKALEVELEESRESVQTARRALEAIDGSDRAARATEAMEAASANMANHMPAWLRSRLAHGLLQEAVVRFRERAQAPMLDAASGYFSTMTDGRYIRLLSDDTGSTPVLMAQRDEGNPVAVTGLSEGTRDQLYLALRLAAIDVRRGAGTDPVMDLPLVLDDVLMSSDEMRAALALRALSEFARNNRVILFTHHRHIAELAEEHVAAKQLRQVLLSQR